MLKPHSDLYRQSPSHLGPSASRFIAVPGCRLVVALFVRAIIQPTRLSDRYSKPELRSNTPVSRQDAQARHAEQALSSPLPGLRTFSFDRFTDGPSEYDVV